MSERALGIRAATMVDWSCWRSRSFRRYACLDCSRESLSAAAFACCAAVCIRRGGGFSLTLNLAGRDGCGLGRTLLALARGLAGSKAWGLGGALLAPVRGLTRGAASGLGRMLLTLDRGLGRRAAWALERMLLALVRGLARREARGLGRTLLALIRVWPGPPSATETGAGGKWMGSAAGGPRQNSCR